jgi:hypothetical protein
VLRDDNSELRITTIEEKNMTENAIDKNRRRAIKLAASSVIAIPFGGMLVGNAIAEELPLIAEDDPQAVALQYVADATKATRADKAGTPGAEQTCKNCQLATSAEGDPLPCQLFPGKSVAAAGWCSAWAKRA